MMIQMKSMIMIGKFDIFLTKIVHLRVGYARRIVVLVFDFTKSNVESRITLW